MKYLKKMRKKKSFFVGAITFIGLLFIFISPRCILSQGWSEAKIQSLPDSCFAIVEVEKNGIKVRHCPHHDINGELDIEQLIYVLGIFENETWLDLKNKELARGHLKKHYQKFLKKLKSREIDRPININQAELSKLIMLWNIGPVKVVKIMEYRKKYGKFKTIEEIKKIKGIGQKIFEAIKDDIKLD